MSKRLKVLPATVIRGIHGSRKRSRSSALFDGIGGGSAQKKAAFRLLAASYPRARSPGGSQPPGLQDSSPPALTALGLFFFCSCLARLIWIWLSLPPALVSQVRRFLSPGKSERPTRACRNVFERQGG